MHGTASDRRNTIPATLVCLALLIVPAGSELACNNPVAHEDVGIGAAQSTTGGASSGFYTVTMTAAPSCSLPDHAMTRSYTVLLKQDGQNVEALLDPYGPFEGNPGFSGTRDGETYRFTLNGDYPCPAEGYSFIHVLNGTEVGYTGTATGTRSDHRIVASFDGKVLLYDHSDQTVLAICDAHDHRMEMVPGGGPITQ